jgi:hypothetical protein
VRRRVLSAFSIIVRLAWDLLQWCGLLLRPRKSLEAEMLFLRRQLALYRERGVKPRRIDAATRGTLAFLSRWFDWQSALVIVRPETLIGGIERASDFGFGGSPDQDGQRFRKSYVI